MAEIIRLRRSTQAGIARLANTLHTAAGSSNGRSRRGDSTFAIKDVALQDLALILLIFDQARLDLGVVIWPNGAGMDPGWMYEQIKMNKSCCPLLAHEQSGEVALGGVAG